MASNRIYADKTPVACEVCGRTFYTMSVGKNRRCWRCRTTGKSGKDTRFAIVASDDRIAANIERIVSLVQAGVTVKWSEHGKTS